MSTGFPTYRPRRTRATANLRAMIRETEVSVKDLIYPIFVVPGTNVKHEIESLPGNYHWSIDRLSECMDEAVMEEDMMEELYETFRNPIDINRATEEQLKQLPFLTDEQAKDILDYIAKNGEMQTLGEMMTIANHRAFFGSGMKRPLSTGYATLAMVSRGMENCTPTERDTESAV